MENSGKDFGVLPRNLQLMPPSAIMDAGAREGRSITREGLHTIIRELRVLARAKGHRLAELTAYDLAAVFRDDTFRWKENDVDNWGRGGGRGVWGV
jgi:hypothetical protein